MKRVKTVLNVVGIVVTGYIAVKAFDKFSDLLDELGGQATNAHNLVD